jgi:hypothetical protein
MIDHERARELALLPATDLDPADRDWLANHLEACESCGTFAADAAFVDATAAEEDVTTLDPDEVSARPATGHSIARRVAFSPALRRRAMLVTVAAVAVAIVAGGLAWNTAPRTDGRVADASQPSRTASASDGRDPWASVEPSASFEPLAGEDPTPTAVLTARGAKGLVVPLNTGFRLASVDATPASRLAARLTVEPAFAFSVKADADDRAATLTPKKPLMPGTVYRFALTGSAGELLDTWAFQARQPLRVVGMLPENQATDVPLDTGIEVTFDQDGVTDAASHVTVKPATRGRFEQHGRTLAFIPDRPLSPATIYNVTVTRGISVASTGEATAIDTRFRFETATKTEPTATSTFNFQDQVVESATAERPIIGLWGFFDGAEGALPKAPKTTPIQVYRLANLDAAIAAFRALRARPDWSRWSTDGLVDTTNLKRVVSIDARLNVYGDGDSYWVQLPNPLPAGWYVVQQTAGARPIQVVLQVTDVAGYLAVSETRTLVWANDLKTGGPLVGAKASSESAAIGRSDAHGLTIGKTPRSLLPQPSDVCASPCDPVVTVRTADGRAIFLPAGTQYDKLEGFGESYYWYAADSRYWSLLHTDRNRYRQTDTVNLWGVVRDRDSGKVPAAIELRLTLQSNGFGPDRPPVATLTLKPGSSGAFSGSIPLAGLPEGYYTVAVLLGDTVIRSSDIIVGPIAKPAYRLEVTTGRRVYIAGDRIKITVNANFFEGTPVPGVPLRIDGFVERKVTTDANGAAIYATLAKAEPDQEGPISTAVQASPATAEEGEIGAASREFVVFPSTRTIDANASFANGKVRVSGSVHLVDVDRLESEITSGRPIWELDPRAAAVAGATVTARFIELVPHRRQVGTQYDFIEKKVVPAYEDTITERAAGTVRVKTGANGTYSVSIPASTADHDYQVIVTVADAGGLVARITSSANRHPWSTYEERNATLRPTTAGGNGTERFGVGDRVDLTMNDPGTKQAASDGTRYLFFTAQRGLRQATVQSSPRFITTFERWAAPNMDVGAVRFTGHGYLRAPHYAAQFRSADRRLQVELSMGAARYAPGDTATVHVRTRTASGAPVAATVILRAVDEKLFTIGAAVEDDPLNELYAPVETGILGTYGSHRNPRTQGGEGGDTTGGGGDDRDDFRDSLLFEMITTGADGRGTTSFKISDDLTSWRVTAAAITSRLDVGAGSVLVPVGLPFFVDASIAPDYLVADRPTIAIRTFGSNLETGDPVSLEVTSTSLGFASGPIRTTAFATVGVPLPQLHAGIETLTITATTGSGASARTDRLTRSFAVVETRLLRTRTNYVELPSGAFSGGDGLTTIVVSDASAGRYLPLVSQLASGGGARLDRGLAADVAESLLVSRYGSAEGSFDPATFAANRYQGSDGGLALLPYSSSDLELSAMVAIVAPDRVDRSRLGGYLRNVLSDRVETRERQMFALAGLAGLGDPVLTAIRSAAADRELTIRERLMIGLGAAALGDAATARSIAAALIADHGEHLGQEARLRVGSSAADVTSATALMAVLGAAIGDRRAPQFWAYVEANPAADRLEVLTAVAYVANTLDHLAVQPASFAYTVGGKRQVVDLDTGETFELGLTAGQLASLKIDRLSGAIGVTSTWREPVRPAAFQADPDVTLSRSVSPSTTIGSSDLVRVELTMKFGDQAAAGCHQVTELVPSGLAPVGSLATWIDPESEALPDPGVVMPYDQSGSRVFFCAEPTRTQRILVLRYYARVITPGTYAWEPAVAESRSQEGGAALTAATTIVVR